MLRKTWRMQENVSKKATPHLMYTHATTYTDHGTFNLETSESSVNASESVVLSIYFIMSMYVFVSMYMHMCEGGHGNQQGVMGFLEEQEFLPLSHLFNLSVFSTLLPFYVYQVFTVLDVGPAGKMFLF